MLKKIISLSSKGSQSLRIKVKNNPIKAIELAGGAKGIVLALSIDGELTPSVVVKYSSTPVSEFLANRFLSKMGVPTPDAELCSVDDLPESLQKEGFKEVLLMSFIEGVDLEKLTDSSAINENKQNLITIGKLLVCSAVIMNGDNFRVLALNSPANLIMAQFETDSSPVLYNIDAGINAILRQDEPLGEPEEFPEHFRSRLKFFNMLLLTPPEAPSDYQPLLSSLYPLVDFPELEHQESYYDNLALATLDDFTSTMNMLLECNPNLADFSRQSNYKWILEGIKQGIYSVAMTGSKELEAVKSSLDSKFSIDDELQEDLRQVSMNIDTVRSFLAKLPNNISYEEYSDYITCLRSRNIYYQIFPFKHYLPELIESFLEKT